MTAVEIEATVPKCEVDVEDESGKFICSYSALYLPAVGDLLLASPGYRNAARRDEQSVYQVVRREWDLDEEPAPTLRLIVKPAEQPAPVVDPAAPAAYAGPARAF